MIEDLFQRCEAAIMHVRCGDRHIPERGNLYAIQIINTDSRKTIVAETASCAQSMRICDVAMQAIGF
jgi:hypothetical protein